MNEVCTTKPRTERLRIQNLQVIFKVVERCNINCSYCYYFNMGEESSRERPAIVGLSVASSLADFIADGCRELGITKVHFGFHGGEPMMLKARNFDAVCETLHRAISPVAELVFAIQTNGTILSDEWLAVFDKHRINVGVSIDGDRAAHDRHRLNHSGKSTFDKTVATLKALVDWADRTGRARPSTISVMHADNNYRDQYRFLRELGVENMSYLLPDRVFDATVPADPGTDPRALGARLNELFDAWFDEDNLDVRVRQIESVMQHFQATTQPVGSPAELASGLDRQDRDFQIIVAQSDGSVTVDDCFIPALDWYSGITAPFSRDVSLSEFLNRREFEEVDAFSAEVPQKCRGCEWHGICGSGDLAHRFSKANGFNNPSPYCDAYISNFTHIGKRLVEDGYPKDDFEQRLRRSRRLAAHSG